jgi:hypothetical protein
VSRKGREGSSPSSRTYSGRPEYREHWHSGYCSAPLRRTSGDRCEGSSPSCSASPRRARCAPGCPARAKLPSQGNRAVWRVRLVWSMALTRKVRGETHVRSNRTPSAPGERTCRGAGPVPKTGGRVVAGDRDFRSPPMEGAPPARERALNPRSGRETAEIDTSTFRSVATTQLVDGACPISRYRSVQFRGGQPWRDSSAGQSAGFISRRSSVRHGLSLPRASGQDGNGTPLIRKKRAGSSPAWPTRGHHHVDETRPAHTVAGTGSSAARAAGL